MPNKVCKTPRTLVVPRGVRRRFMSILRLITCMAAMLLICGDVESNPGPSTESRSTRQTTLSFADVAAIPASPVEPNKSGTTPRLQSVQKSRPQTRSSGSQKPAASDPDIMTFLRDMRSKFNSNLESINSKIDGITSSIESLQIENEALRQENTQIKAKLDRLYSKVDSLEGHSCRNNLSFVVFPAQPTSPGPILRARLESS